MMIDLEKLLNHEQEGIAINQQITFPSSYLINSEIKEMGPVTVKGNCHLDQTNVVLIGIVSGEMKLVDSISLEDISYSFSIEFEEVFKENERNHEKSLDITDILWQYIILEVPLKQTEVTDFSKYRGDGWKLVTEEEIKKANNPFEELANMWGEE